MCIRDRHDAARPNFSIRLLKNIAKNLKNNKAVVPIINSKDTIKYKTQNRIFNLNRNNLLLTQTPQAFRFEELYKICLLYTSPSPRDRTRSRMPSSA